MLTHVLKGAGNKQIGIDLGITEQAVKEHVSTMLDKFDVPNRAALAEAGARLEFAGEPGVDRSWMRELFLAAQPQICIARGPEIRYEAVNEAFLEAVGNRPLIGRTMREAFPEIADQGVYEIVERVYSTGQPIMQHEVRRSWDRGSGKEERLIDVLIQPLHDTDGKVNGIVSFVFDVTEVVEERRHAELVGEEFAALLDMLASGVIVVDEKGHVVKINEAGKRIARLPVDFGRNIGEQPRSVFDLRDVLGNPVALADMPVARALHGEDVLPREFTFVAGDPLERVKLRVTVRPLRDPDGAIRGALVLFTELESKRV